VDILRLCAILQVLTVREILSYGVVNHMGARVELEEMAMTALTYSMDEGVEITELREEDRPYLSDDYKREVLQHMSIMQLIDTIMINPTVHISPSYRDTGLSASYTFQPLSNLVYTRDQQITTCKGIVMGKLRSSQRQLEVEVMKFCFRKLGMPWSDMSVHNKATSIHLSACTACCACHCMVSQSAMPGKVIKQLKVMVHDDAQVLHTHMTPNIGFSCVSMWDSHILSIQLPPTWSKRFCHMSAHTSANHVHGNDLQKEALVGRQQKDDVTSMHDWIWPDGSGLPVVGEIEEPGFLEGGDYFAAGEDLALVGVGLRSNQEACDQLMQRNWLGTDRLAVVRDDFEQHQVSTRGTQQLKKITHGLKSMKVLGASIIWLAW